MLQVLPFSPAVASAGLAWMAALWMTPRYLRRRNDIRLCLYWRSVTLFAVSLTVVVPAVHDTVDRLVGVPNVTRWICDALVLTSVYLFDTFYSALVHAPARLCWHRSWVLGSLVLTLVVMAVVLSRRNLPLNSLTVTLPRVEPTLIAYRLIFLGVCGFFVVRVMLHTAYYLRYVPHPLVKVSMLLLVAAGIGGLGNLGFTSATVLIPLAAPRAHFAHVAHVIQDGAQLSALVAVVSLMLSVTVPGWGKRVGLPAIVRHVRVLVTYRRLQPLWWRLTQAQPHVVLPLTVVWPYALWHVQEMEVLLHRRVIEILDARWLLLTGVPGQKSGEGGLSSVADMPQRFMRHTESSASYGVSGSLPRVRALRAGVRHRAMSLEPPGQRGSADGSGNPAQLEQEHLDHLARTEATLLALRPGDAAHGDWLLGPGIEVYQPATYGQALYYLERVAAALATERSRRGVGISRRTPAAGMYQVRCS